MRVEPPEWDWCPEKKQPESWLALFCRVRSRLSVGRKRARTKDPPGSVVKQDI